MTTTAAPSPHSPGTPSAPIDAIAEPEHDELSIIVAKLCRTLDEAVDAGFHSSGHVVFDQREVDVIAYVRAYALASEVPVPA